jgi:formylglycine-generating enzyme required for sulfatase activity
VASPDGHPYPWGDAFPTCHFAITRDCGRMGGPRAVGSIPAGASPDGILDLIGNVWEWTATADPSKNDFYVVLGGSWANPDGTEKGGVDYFNPVDRKTFLAQGKGYQSVSQGFRCVYLSPPE